MTIRILTNAQQVASSCPCRNANLRLTRDETAAGFPSDPQHIYMTATAILTPRKCSTSAANTAFCKAWRWHSKRTAHTHRSDDVSGLRLFRSPCMLQRPQTQLRGKVHDNPLLTCASELHSASPRGERQTLPPIDENTGFCIISAIVTT